MTSSSSSSLLIEEKGDWDHKNRHIEQQLDAWQPEPLVPSFERENFQHILKPHIVTSKPGAHIEVDGVKCLNYSTPNYLGLACDKRIEAATLSAVKKYGVGSCGPRAFYGTMDVHLKLEDEIAQFLQVEEAILYAFGFATIASAIPAYAKANDLIFADECCNFAIQQGVHVSRAKVFLFKHNDTQHLRQLIQQVGVEKLRKARSFIIVEGLYDRTGTICPIKELIDIKKEFKIRLFVDESHSMGVLGSQGKGVTQHFQVNIKDVDLIMASIENAFCSYGGFCAGSSFVVDHQRLAGSGYIFSASLPPLQVLAALQSLNIVREDPEIIASSQAKFRSAHSLLSSLKHFRLVSDEISPIKHLVLKKHLENEWKFGDEGTHLKQLRFEANANNKSVQQKDVLAKYRDEFETLRKFCDKILRTNQISINPASYIEDEEWNIPIPSIKLIIHGGDSGIDIRHLDKLRSILETEWNGQ